MMPGNVSIASSLATAMPTGKNNDRSASPGFTTSASEPQTENSFPNPANQRNSTGIVMSTSKCRDEKCNSISAGHGKVSNGRFTPRTQRGYRGVASNSVSSPQRRRQNSSHQEKKQNNNEGASYDKASPSAYDFNSVTAHSGRKRNIEGGRGADVDSSAATHVANCSAGRSVSTKSPRQSLSCSTEETSKSRVSEKAENFAQSGETSISGTRSGRCSERVFCDDTERSLPNAHAGVRRLDDLTIRKFVNNWRAPQSTFGTELNENPALDPSYSASSQQQTRCVTDSASSFRCESTIPQCTKQNDTSPTRHSSSHSSDHLNCKSPDECLQNATAALTAEMGNQADNAVTKNDLNPVSPPTATNNTTPSPAPRIQRYTIEELKRLRNISSASKKPNRLHKFVDSAETLTGLNLLTSALDLKRRNAPPLPAFGPGVNAQTSRQLQSGTWVGGLTSEADRKNSAQQDFDCRAFALLSSEKSACTDALPEGKLETAAVNSSTTEVGGLFRVFRTEYIRKPRWRHALAYKQYWWYLTSEVFSSMPTTVSSKRQTEEAATACAADIVTGAHPVTNEEHSRMENPVKLSCAHKLLTQPESVEGNNKTPENKPVSGFGNDSDSEHKTCVQSDSQTYGGLLSVTSGLTEAHSLQPSSHQSRCFSMASGNELHLNAGSLASNQLRPCSDLAATNELLQQFKNQRQGENLGVCQKTGLAHLHPLAPFNNNEIIKTEERTEELWDDPKALDLGGAEENIFSLGDIRDAEQHVQSGFPLHHFLHAARQQRNADFESHNDRSIKASEVSSKTGSSTLPNADPETPYGIPCLTRVEPLPRSSLEDSVFFYDEEEDDVSFAGSSFLNHLFKKDVQLPTTAHERSLTERPVESEQTIRFPAEYAGARHPAQAASAGSLVSETELARRLAQEIRVMLTPEQQQRLRARLEEQRLTLEHQQLQQQQPRQVQLKSQTPSNVSSFVGPESHVTNQEWVLQQLRLVQQQEQKQRFPGDMRACQRTDPLPGMPNNGVGRQTGPLSTRQQGTAFGAPDSQLKKIPYAHDFHANSRPSTPPLTDSRPRAQRNANTVEHACTVAGRHHGGPRSNQGNVELGPGQASAEMSGLSSLLQLLAQSKLNPNEIFHLIQVLQQRQQQSQQQQQPLQPQVVRALLEAYRASQQQGAVNQRGEVQNCQGNLRATGGPPMQNQKSLLSLLQQRTLAPQVGCHAPSTGCSVPRQAVAQPRNPGVATQPQLQQLPLLAQQQLQQQHLLEATLQQQIQHQRSHPRQQQLRSSMHAPGTSLFTHNMYNNNNNSHRYQQQQQALHARGSAMPQSSGTAQNVFAQHFDASDKTRYTESMLAAAQAKQRSTQQETHLTSSNMQGVQNVIQDSQFLHTRAGTTGNNTLLNSVPPPQHVLSSYRQQPANFSYPGMSYPALLSNGGMSAGGNPMVRSAPNRSAMQQPLSDVGSSSSVAEIHSLSGGGPRSLISASSSHHNASTNWAADVTANRNSEASSFSSLPYPTAGINATTPNDSTSCLSSHAQLSVVPRASSHQPLPATLQPKQFPQRPAWQSRANVVDCRQPLSITKTPPSELSSNFNANAGVFVPYAAGDFSTYAARPTPHESHTTQDSNYVGNHNPFLTSATPSLQSTNVNNATQLPAPVVGGLVADAQPIAASQKISVLPFPCSVSTSATSAPQSEAVDDLPAPPAASTHTLLPRPDTEFSASQFIKKDDNADTKSAPDLGAENGAAFLQT